MLGRSDRNTKRLFRARSAPCVWWRRLYLRSLCGIVSRTTLVPPTVATPTTTRTTTTRTFTSRATVWPSKCRCRSGTTIQGHCSPSTGEDDDDNDRHHRRGDPNHAPVTPVPVTTKVVVFVEWVVPRRTAPNSKYHHHHHYPRASLYDRWVLIRPSFVSAPLRRQLPQHSSRPGDSLTDVPGSVGTCKK